MKRRQRGRLADTHRASFPEKSSSGMKTVICVCRLWMSSFALLCLLYLVLLKAATIHHYLAADAPNHTILPLIYINTFPLENPIVHSGMHCVDPSFPAYLQLSTHSCEQSPRHSFIHPSGYLSIRCYIHLSTYAETPQSFVHTSINTLSQ